MKNRSELREVIVKVIYQTIILEEAKLEYNVNDLIKEQLEVQNEFVDSCVHGILENKSTLSKLANKYLSRVDQAILLLGIYELKYTETPSVVAINEAIELSKKYSDEAVTKMINGVLDKVYHEEEQ